MRNKKRSSSIGISLSGREYNSEQILRFTVAAKKAGLDSVWLPSVPEFRDGVEIANFVASHVRHYTIALGIISVYSRSPLSLASSIATIAERAKTNELILGIGVGDSKWKMLAGDSHYEKPLSFMLEYHKVLSKLLDGEHVDYVGKFFNVQNVKLQIRVPKPRPRIYWAATGPKMLGVAFKCADGIVLNGVLGQDYYRRFVKRAQSRKEGLGVVWPFPISVAGSNAVARRAMKPFLTRMIVSAKVDPILYASPFNSTIDKMKNCAVTSGQDEAMKMLTNEMIDYFSISGTAAVCAKRIDDLFSWGDFLPVLYPVATNPIKIISSVSSIIS